MRYILFLFIALFYATSALAADSKILLNNTSAEITNKTINCLYNTCLNFDGEITELNLTAKAEPDDPSSGRAVVWLSNGTGQGNAYDLMLKINVAGAVKYASLLDYGDGIATLPKYIPTPYVQAQSGEFMESQIGEKLEWQQ